jgi:hypothetical protein
MSVMKASVLIRIAKSLSTRRARVDFGNPLETRRRRVGASNVILNQMRWKTSVPRTLRPANVALPLATMVVGLTKRPDQLVVTLQSDVQFLDVWKTTREPRTLPASL